VIKEKKITPNAIDKLIDDCITELCSDDVTKGGECLQELAQYWAKAGLTQKSFLDMREYIILSAERKTDKAFIREKLSNSERVLREKRTGSIIITH